MRTQGGWQFGLAVMIVAASIANAQSVNRELAASERRGLTPLERSVRTALSADPATAPYRIGTDLRDGQLVLTGRVATSAIHDIAVQTALAFTPSVHDELVIDTAETVRALTPQPTGNPGAGGMPIAAYPSASVPGASTYSSPPYYYPQPLFGRLDEPFYGFEPPNISYPPWWGQLTQQRLGEMLANARQDAALMAAAPEPEPVAKTAEKRTLDLDVDENGVATVSGTVANEAQADTIIKQIEKTPGVTRVVNQLSIGDGAEALRRPIPPPPPPGLPAAEPRAAAPAAEAAPAGRIPAAPIKPASSESTARVDIRDGVAYLDGRVASLVDAMEMHLSAGRTPGIRAVDDRLIVPLPNERTPNPLVDYANRGDVAAYLRAQIVKHVAGAAFIDDVALDGQRLVIRGQAPDEASRSRALAVLRTMAVLRGFDVTPTLKTTGTEATTRELAR